MGKEKLKIAIKYNKDGKEIIEFLISLGYKNSLKLEGTGSRCRTSYYVGKDDLVIYHLYTVPDDFRVFESLEEAKKYYGMKEEKELKIQIPEGYEIDKENSTFECIKFKRKELTYDDIAKELFHEKELSYINQFGEINTTTSLEGEESFKCLNNCTSQTQAEKLLAINKLMNVAKYLNGSRRYAQKTGKYKTGYYIIIDENDSIKVDYACINGRDIVYFNSRENAERAIKILGKDTIKLALVSDY